MTSQSETTKRFGQAAIEAAKRAEATALLIRCGFHVHRPEADVEGEDLVLRQPAGMLIPVYLKPRIYVDGQRYSGLGLFMLFPLGPFTPAASRPWFLAPHDPLYAEVEKRHGLTPKWTGHWHSAYPGSALRDYLTPFGVTPPPEPEAPEAAQSI